MDRIEWLRLIVKNEGISTTKELYDFYSQYVDEFGEVSFESYKRYCREALYVKIDHIEEVLGERNQPVIERTVYTNEEQQFTVLSKNILTIEDLTKISNIDTNKWECHKIVSNRWADQFQIKGWFRLKQGGKITPEEYAERFNYLLEHYNPPKVERRKLTDQKVMVELAFFDFHFGQLSWAKETGDSDYDIDIAAKLFSDTTDYFIDRVRSKVGLWLIPVGNDFFNSDTILNTTLKGTWQAEDTRWQKTFYTAEEMYISQIDKLLQIAPVKLLVVPGNHDTTRTFYLGEFLKAWYRNNENVEVDNSPKQRKYVKWGNTLLGFTHGNEEVRGSLPALMPQEVPNLFAETEYREWHTGHLHGYSEKTSHYTKESFGVREVILPALVPLDDWHTKKGYRHLREALAIEFDWDFGRITDHHFHPGM